MAFHDQPRFTKDIDMLVIPEDLEKIRKAFNDIECFESAKPWTFKNTKLTLHRFMKIEGEDYLTVDVLLGHEDKHKDIIRKALNEETEKGYVRFARKEDIIWMKKFRNSEQDQVDIRRLQND